MMTLLVCLLDRQRLHDVPAAPPHLLAVRTPTLITLSHDPT